MQDRLSRAIGPPCAKYGGIPNKSAALTAARDETDSLRARLKSLLPGVSRARCGTK